jgi:hypothetical protein
MDIANVGHCTVRSPGGVFQLKNVLHVPQAHKNLCSVNRFTKDNHVYFEFHPTHFLIKEPETRRTLHRGSCEGGLYPLHSTNKVFEYQHRLPFIFDHNKNRVCDACQQGKIHQLPYPKSTSVSAGPMDLIFSDVWGPSPTSVGNHNYYVSFIDDYNKFTWLFLIRHKYEVFACFHKFQSLVERQIGRKVLAVQSEGGQI